MEFKEYLAIIRRRWLLFLAIFVTIVGAHLAWVSYGQGSHYLATTKVIIGSERVLPAHNAERLPILPLQGLSAQTKESTITDYPVLKRAAELALGERSFESKQFHEGPFPQRITEGRTTIAGHYGDSPEPVQQIIEDLRESVTVGHKSDRQIVSIDVEGDNASEAQLFSWAMAEGAHQFHNEKARESVDQFLEELGVKIEDAKRELKSAREGMLEEQQKLGIANFAEKERMILENIYRVEEQESHLLAGTRKNERLIQYRLQEQSFSGRIDLDAEAGETGSSRLDRIRDKLFEAKLALESKVATLSAKHPEVQRVKARIAGLQKAMAAEQDAILGERYKSFSQETNELIKENSLLALEREVLEERKAKLHDELLALSSMRQQFQPKEIAYQDAQERLGYLQRMEKDVLWFAKGKLGSVVVYDPAIEARPVILQGGRFGPLVLTLLMAFVFALGVVYIVEYVDTRVKNEHDVRRHLNLPLLGMIPREVECAGLLTEAPPQSEIAEKFNTAATLIQSISRELHLQALMVCSAIAREGKTTVSANLAVALARKGARVLLVDGDLRISQLHNVLRLPNNVGLVNALDSRIDADQFIEGVMSEETLDGRPSSAQSFVQRSHIPNLEALTSGPPSGDPVHLLESGRLARLVAEFKQSYDFIIFDTPPINKVGDALTISSVVDGSIFVVGSGQAEQHDVMWAKHLLTNVHSNILGVFLNKYSKQKGSEYYYYYYANDQKRKRIKTRA